MSDAAVMAVALVLPEVALLAAAQDRVALIIPLGTPNATLSGNFP